MFIDKMAKELESERTFMLQFYKDQYKVYQPVKELAAGVVYYIGVNWEPKLDWDENNGK